MPSPPKQPRRDNTAPADLEPPPPAAPPPDDLTLVQRGLDAEGDLADVLAAIQEAQAAHERLGTQLAARLEARKAELAQLRPRLRVLRERNYAGRAGTFRGFKGAEYDQRKLGEAAAFAAISAQGKLGFDFEFLPAE